MNRIGQAEWNKFSQVVLASGRWAKWTDSLEDDQKVIVAGHYCFNTPEYQDIITKLEQHADWDHEIQSALWQVFDIYTNNL